MTLEILNLIGTRYLIKKVALNESKEIKVVNKYWKGRKIYAPLARKYTIKLLNNYCRSLEAYISYALPLDNSCIQRSVPRREIERAWPAGWFKCHGEYHRAHETIDESTTWCQAGSMEEKNGHGVYSTWPATLCRVSRSLCAVYYCIIASGNSPLIHGSDSRNPIVFRIF